METTEVVTNIKAIEKDFINDLNNAEAATRNDVPQGVVSDSAVVAVNVPKFAAKLVCDLKNSIEAKFLEKDLDEGAKEIVREFLRTTDKEVELYQQILSQVGTNYTPDEYKALINKWLNSPIVLLIEHEIQKILTLRNALKEYAKNNKGKDS